MRLVLDTNILVSALLTRNSPPDQLYQAWMRGRFDLVTSDWQVAELRRVLGYARLEPYIRPDEAALLVENLDSLAVVVGPLQPGHHSPDPDDNWIIATAIAGRADRIVSGDKAHLLSLGSVEGIAVINARAAAELMAER